MTKIDISIIIVSYNTVEITSSCIRSIIQSKTNYIYEIILVDNNSTDNTTKIIQKEFTNITIINLDNNRGFSKANNIGIKIAKGEYILLLNSDTILFEDSLEGLLLTAINKKYEIVGPVLLNADHSIQRSWFDFPSLLKISLRLLDCYKPFYKFKNLSYLELIFFGKKPAFMHKCFETDTSVDYLSFACILIERKIIERIGFLDENLFFYQEDCEYGLRANANNIPIIYTTSSRLIHLGGSSSSKFSWFAFENDILGLLHIYKKYYSKYSVFCLKFILYFILCWRKTLLNFGFYKEIKKSGLYKKGKTIKLNTQLARNNYNKLISLVYNYPI
jgi:GT2 family glycosyltransferase